MGRRSFLVTVLSCVVLLTAAAVEAKGTKSKGGKKGMSYQGTIVAVAKNNISIDIGIDKPQRMMVAIDANTAVTGGGKQGTIADLAKGQFVSVEVAKGKATKIDVSTPAPATTN